MKRTYKIRALWPVPFVAADKVVKLSDPVLFRGYGAVTELPHIRSRTYWPVPLHWLGRGADRLLTKLVRLVTAWHQWRRRPEPPEGDDVSGWLGLSVLFHIHDWLFDGHSSIYREKTVTVKED
jgi:hypothetical protein